MTATTTRTTIERTEHPHVIKGGGLGGQPRIDDQRISVLQLFDMYTNGCNILQRTDMVYVEGRLIPRRALKEIDIPPGAKVYTWETLPEEMNH
jgi:hypothetical protein